MRLTPLPLVLLVLWAVPAARAHAALDFRSTQSHPTIFYDAPSQKAEKLYLVGPDYPVEVVVNLEGWVKVRDASGELIWVEQKDLGARRTVIVTAPVADVKAAANSAAGLVFQAEKDVILELLEYSAAGWVKVRHRDGQTGFISIAQIWGI